MARSQKKPTAAIQKLLDEKRQIERWLARLESAADKTPEDVRQRVSADYRKRLVAVVAELQGYRDELDTTLQQQREERDRLAAEEHRISERMSEAELRHAVGEYDERRWGELRTEILESLVKVREDLKTVQQEIKTLNEVIGLLSEPAAADAAAEEEVASLDDTPPMLASSDIASEHEPDEVPARSKKEKGQTDAFDELAFLKSVTEDETHGPEAKRATGMQRLSTQDIASPMEDLEVEDEAPARPAKPAKRGIGAEGVKALKDTSVPPAKGTSKKTLKCAECGAQNLPTEWYCERCGAELAAL